MRTVAQLVGEIIDGSPFLAEVLGEGIANTTEIARKIRPEVEARLYEEVTDASVAMALHRLSKKMQKQQFGSTFLTQMSDITVRSKIIEFVFPNSELLPKIIQALSKSMNGREKPFLNFSQGLHESVVVMSGELEKEFLSLFKSKKFKRMENLSVITLRLPQTSLHVPGVYYPILKALAMTGISFVEIMSVDTEMSIVFHDKDVEKAFGILKRLTSR